MMKKYGITYVCVQYMIMIHCMIHVYDATSNQGYHIIIIIDRFSRQVINLERILFSFFLPQQCSKPSNFLLIVIFPSTSDTSLLAVVVPLYLLYSYYHKITIIIQTERATHLSGNRGVSCV